MKKTVYDDFEIGIEYITQNNIDKKRDEIIINKVSNPFGFVPTENVFKVKETLDSQIDILAQKLKAIKEERSILTVDLLIDDLMGHDKLGGVWEKLDWDEQGEIINRWQNIIIDNMD